VINDGKLIKPVLSQCDSTTVPYVLKERICSPDVLTEAKNLLESTADKVPMRQTSIPGTTVAGKGAIVRSYADKNNHSVFMQCIGHFPAENPKYSCVVVIHANRNDIGKLALPMLKRIMEFVECGYDK